MRHIFFDIESANNTNHMGNICEFGYVIVDENFNIQEQDNIIINPDCTFEKFVLEHILNYSEEYYLSCPKYPEQFPKIKEVFTKADGLTIGHTIDNDANYLNQESRRDKLDFINFSFYDIKLVYEMYSKDSSGLALEKICEKLHIDITDLDQHNALADSIATMRIAKTICGIEKVNLDQLISLYGDYPKGYTENGLIHLLRDNNQGEEKVELTSTIGERFGALKEMLAKLNK